MAIAFCGKPSCTNAFQDKTYGKGMRVMNDVKNDNRSLETLRCTVCNSELTRSRKDALPDDDKKGKGKKPTSKEVAKDLAEDKEVPAKERPSTKKKK